MARAQKHRCRFGRRAYFRQIDCASLTGGIAGFESCADRRDRAGRSNIARTGIPRPLACNGCTLLQISRSIARALLAVLLDSSRAQTGETVLVDRILPGQEFLDR